jgi:hypothetical protein
MMAYEEVIQRTREVADAEGWTWREPVSVIPHRRWLSWGALEWHVRTNAEERGGNILIHIDDATGRVVHEGYGSR